MHRWDPFDPRPPRMDTRTVLLATALLILLAYIIGQVV